MENKKENHGFSDNDNVGSPKKGNKKQSKESKKITKLIQELTDTLAHIYLKNRKINRIVNEFEEEGYEVDVFMTYLTLFKKDHTESGNEGICGIVEASPVKPRKKDLEVHYKLNSFDVTFLNGLKIKTEPLDIGADIDEQ